MKKKDWLILALALLAAAALRVLQCGTGFDEEGLPAGSVLLRALVPCILVLAAVYFCLAARALPTRTRAGEVSDGFFSFRDTLAAGCGIAGAFLTMLGAAAGALGHGSLTSPLLAAVGVAGAACVLFAVFTLYRGGALSGVVMLVPVCCLVVYLIFLYRADASDPVLAHIYVEILALCALTLSALERAAFSFQNGSQRVYFPVAAMALLLALTAAAERRSLAAMLLFLGCALVEGAFLTAAKLKR